MQWIDVRSDTVTQPTPAMREVMQYAPVGDDVYGDDPTVQALEAQAADKLGMEAALFVPTGTMGNQLAIFTHCLRGDEVIAADDCHIVWHEAGAAAVIAGVQLRTVDSRDGMMPTAEVARRIRVGDDIHCPKTGLICLENAHSGGRVLPLAYMREIRAIAHEHGVPIHLDGARVFNAAVSLGADVREIAALADSVMFCLSKGLAAPVGSILAGRADFIAEARRKRKLLGGGMRQVGVLAAPGLIALNDMSQRLDEDHANARYLAEQLARLPGVEVDLAAVEINLVWFSLPASLPVAPLMAALEAAGVKANPPEAGRMRMVTHWQVGRGEIDRIVAAMRSGL
ncbi:low-specificity L-threonine aldolase [Paludibacterium purpuratum]|uniref:L-threonine aldolase n=1 Tax=Paludibacterium purpuratum TaxID=1144873 RepID=A0A4R7B8Y3_9NEIS|nr:low-specificity L-threonine aldolase [Paludibacterium purpuratum]TDR80402.1 L-threonine aldolase [Paludibacterium purpuratum]